MSEMLDAPSDDDDLPRARSAASSALREALRRARLEAAEQSDVVNDLREAEIARLEILKDALDPVFDAAPDEVDLFDVGLVGGDRPRLFVDMVAFVEMGRDRRTYRFLRDGRRGRACVAESSEIAPIVDAVTDYVARRLVERERLLVDDGLAAAAVHEPERRSVEQARPPAPVRGSAGRGWLRAIAILFAFGFGAGLGALLVTGLILASAEGLLPL